MAEVIPEQTIVRVKNLHPTRPFINEYASNKYRIEPAGDPQGRDEIMVPYFAMVYWFGDPRAIDVGDRNSQPHLQHRTFQREHLDVLYGTYGDAWYPEDWEINDTNADAYPEKRHVNLPRCVVHDLAGNRLWTVLDDPEGTHLSPATQTVNDSKNLQAAVQEMQAQIQSLTNQLALSDPEAAAALLPVTAPPPDTEPASVASIVAGMAGADDDDRDPEVDPEDPAAHAGPDLPPGQRSAVVAAKAKAAAKKAAKT